MAQAPTAERGIVVMAYGRREYQRQAANLGLSRRRHSPHLPVALVSDEPDRHSTQHFDTIVRLDEPRRTDCWPKLLLDRYSPYEQTLYIDADALVVRDLAPLFQRFEEHEFAVFGRTIDRGHWYGDVTTMCATAGTVAVPKFNSGFMYFRKTERTLRVFSDARALAEHYEDMRFDRFNGGVADEPVLSIALARHGFSALPTDPSLCVSMLEISGPLRIDTLSGHASFEKKGQPMAPAVVHFAADFSSRYQWAGAHYRRECLKLALSQRSRLPRAVPNILAQMVHGIPCSYVNLFLRWKRRAPGEPRQTVTSAS